ncbi:hypothetical protein ANO14919_029870 [Xylariales sp. No.14919]|nr:hypothetical protein ANO14919_029870 [Xylariales sp. No.14919]
MTAGTSSRPVHPQLGGEIQHPVYLALHRLIVQRRIGDGDDNQNMVSQVVDWSASLVDSVSYVTKKLNISGALSVSVDAIGSVVVSEHYVDDKAPKESDAIYDIAVNMTH